MKTEGKHGRFGRRMILAGLLSLCCTPFAWSALPHYELAYRLSGTGGMMLKDDKVDQWINRPVLVGEFAVEFLPTGRWHCLQQ